MATATAADPQSPLPQGLFEDLADGDDARARRAAGFVSLLGLADPASLKPAIESVLAWLFESRAPLARRLEVAAGVAGVTPTERLVLELSRAEPERRAVAARALGNRAHVVTRTVLMATLMHDDEAVVRAAAAHALGAQAERRSARTLATIAVDDDDAGVRRACIEALRALDPLGATTAFVRGAGDDDVTVRTAALTALLAVGGPAACRTARAGLRDSTPAVRALAALILAQHGTARDARRLEPLFDDEDPGVRRAARVAQFAGGDRDGVYVAERRQT